MTTKHLVSLTNRCVTGLGGVPGLGGGWLGAWSFVWLAPHPYSWTAMGKNQWEEAQDPHPLVAMGGLCLCFLLSSQDPDYCIQSWLS
jgi:hypothetical protein